MPPRDLKTIHNERLKLTANVLNTVAGESITVGLITPAVAYVLDLQGMRAQGAATVVALGLAWLAIGGCLTLGGTEAPGRPSMSSGTVLLLAGPVLAIIAGAMLYLIGRPRHRDRHTPAK